MNTESSHVAKKHKKSIYELQQYRYKGKTQLHLNKSTYIFILEIFLKTNINKCSTTSREKTRTNLPDWN